MLKISLGKININKIATIPIITFNFDKIQEIKYPNKIICSNNKRNKYSDTKRKSKSKLKNTLPLNKEIMNKNIY